MIGNRAAVSQYARAHVENAMLFETATQSALALRR